MQHDGSLWLIKANYVPSQSLVSFMPLLYFWKIRCFLWNTLKGLRWIPRSVVQNTFQGTVLSPLETPMSARNAFEILFKQTMYLANCFLLHAFIVLLKRRFLWNTFQVTALDFSICCPLGYRCLREMISEKHILTDELYSLTKENLYFNSGVKTSIVVQFITFNTN